MITGKVSFQNQDTDIDQQDKEMYSDFINHSPDSSYFSRYEYLELIAAITGGKIVIFFAMQDDNEVIGVLPAIVKNGKWGAVVNSLPFYGSNPGIVVKKENNWSIGAFREVKKFLLDAFWQTPGFFSATLIEPPFEKDGDLYDQHSATFMDHRTGLITFLPSSQSEILDLYHSKTRNLVRKAEKAGVKVISNHLLPEVKSDLISIIEMIHVENMQAIGAPDKPGKFFDWIEQKYRAGDQAIKIYTGIHKKEIIAGLIVLVHNQTAEYFMPIIKTQYRNLAPLNIVIYHAMKELVAQGITKWNWGGTKLPGQEGVYHFKKRFGASECIYRYFIRTSSKITGGSYTRQAILEEYPYFYIVPFDALPQVIRTPGNFYEEAAE